MPGAHRVAGLVPAVLVGGWWGQTALLDRLLPLVELAGWGF